MANSQRQCPACNALSIRLHCEFSFSRRAVGQGANLQLLPRRNAVEPFWFSNPGLGGSSQESRHSKQQGYFRDLPQNSQVNHSYLLSNSNWIEAKKHAETLLLVRGTLHDDPGSCGAGDRLFRLPVCLAVWLSSCLSICLFIYPLSEYTSISLLYLQPHNPVALYLYIISLYNISISLSLCISMSLYPFTRWRCPSLLGVILVAKFSAALASLRPAQ